MTAMTAMPPFRLHRPTTAFDAVAALGSTPGSRPLAGGTDLIVNLRHGLGRDLGEPPALVDLSAIADLDRIKVGPAGLALGATVSLARLAEAPGVREGWPVLAQAAAAVAGPTHREAATLAGNLCQDTRCVFLNQSEWWRASNGYCMKAGGDVCQVVPKSNRCHAAYAGDVAPALLVLNATLEVLDANGPRRLPLHALFNAEDGDAHLTLPPGTIVTAVHVPPPDGCGTGYAKVRVRESIDFPLAGVAIALGRDGDRLTRLRVALTGVASAPVLVSDLDGLTGAPWSDEAAATLSAAVGKACAALRTTTASPRYRRAVATGTAARLAGTLWAEAASPGV